MKIEKKTKDKFCYSLLIKVYTYTKWGQVHSLPLKKKKKRIDDIEKKHIWPFAHIQLT